MTRCAVCQGDGSGPCATASGRHWFADPGAEPMPEADRAVLAAALTDPALRTPEQHALVAEDTARREGR